MENSKSFFNSLSQIALPVFTLGGQLAVSLKYPQYGLILSLIAQPFWLYSSWKAYKEAGQVGLLITTVIFGFIIVGGIINYWFL